MIEQTTPFSKPSLFKECRYWRDKFSVKLTIRGEITHHSLGQVMVFTYWRWGQYFPHLPYPLIFHLWNIGERLTSWNSNIPRLYWFIVIKNDHECISLYQFFRIIMQFICLLILTSLTFYIMSWKKAQEPEYYYKIK